MSAFSNRLKELRKMNKLTVRETSEMTGIPVSTYRSWEEGVKIVGEEAYPKLCSVFKVSLHKLITGQDEEFILSRESSNDLKNKVEFVKNTILEIENVMTSTGKNESIFFDVMK